ncbi:MAG: hypothetical protein K2O48_04445, partial [Prevotella sp.]|nr:hypothetical protein [Prevotella sp.]
MIQLAGRHAQELVDCQPGAEQRDDDAEQEDGSTRQRQHVPRHDVEQPGLGDVEAVDQSLIHN